MSKRFDNLVNAVQAFLNTAGCKSFQFNIKEFREFYKLSSYSKREIVSAFDDALTLTETVERFGGWTLAEVESPVYQLNAVADIQVKFLPHGFVTYEPVAPASNDEPAPVFDAAVKQKTETSVLNKHKLDKIAKSGKGKSGKKIGKKDQQSLQAVFPPHAAPATN